MEPVQTEHNKFLVPLAVVLAGGLIAAAIYFGDSTSQGITNTGDSNTPVEVPEVTAKDHIRGSRTADVVVVEYSDTECPYCKTFHSTMKDIVTQYNGRVAWVYRHFPIDQLHKKAIKEAEATECAAELGGNQAFWNYIDRIFEITNSNDTLDADELPKIASSIGLDVNAFNTCLSSGRHNAFVLKSVEEAVKTGARGTPYSVALAKDGEQVVINGAEPIAMVKAKLDILLK